MNKGLTLVEMERLQELGDKNYTVSEGLIEISDNRTEAEEKEYRELMKRYREYGSI